MPATSWPAQPPSRGSGEAASSIVSLRVRDLFDRIGGLDPHAVACRKLAIELLLHARGVGTAPLADQDVACIGERGASGRLAPRDAYEMRAIRGDDWPMPAVVHEL